MKILHSQSLGILFLFCLIMVLSFDTRAQTVVNRARIGGFAEDITYVTSGELKDQIVMMNGYELHAVSLAKKKGVLTRICKIDNPEIDQSASGFTFVESEGLFVMNNAPHPNKLFFFDQACRIKGTRTIQYLDSNYRPLHIEGMAYIPESSPVFPDHLMMVTWDVNLTAVRIVIMRRDGVQVSEIARNDWPNEFSSGGGLGDITFLAPNRLVASTFSVDSMRSLWIIDFNGNIVLGPLPGMTGSGEGVVQISDGRLVSAKYPQSLLLFDENLNRQPGNDRHDIIGLNLSVPSGIAWDSDANKFLVIYDTILNTGPLGISGVATTLDSAIPLFAFSTFPFTRQTVYLPQEDIIATMRIGAPNRAILLFNLNGTLNSEISLEPSSLGQNLGLPVGLTYLPNSDEFVVSFNGIAPTRALEQQRLRVISRAGTLVRTIDVSATGAIGIRGIEYFEDPQGGGGRLLLMSAVGRVFVTDLNGNSRNVDGSLMGEFNSRVKLGLITSSDLAAITSGPLAGAFAMVDRSGGEIVIFRLD